jgi:hypothetical protein
MNFFISLLGWFLWNWAELTVTKAQFDDDNDEKTKFKIREYAYTHWTIWIGSAACIFLLLWVGYKNLSIDPLAPVFGVNTKLGWNDLYLLGSGAAFDAIIYATKAIKKFFKKKEAQL